VKTLSEAMINVLQLSQMGTTKLRLETTLQRLQKAGISGPGGG
jgi:hypothetical protein